jgi:hypothetical protein
MFGFDSRPVRIDSKRVEIVVSYFRIDFYIDFFLFNSFLHEYIEM